MDQPDPLPDLEALTSGAPLPREFYLQPTVKVARDLLGQLLVHDSPEGRTAGVIVETEAYLVDDPGSHAHRGRTPRNEVMFAAPGTIYVYRIYGVHWCLNAVTQPEGVPEAVLLRALEPVTGIDLMRQRRGRKRLTDLCSGPGKLCQALGVTGAHNRGDLTSPPLYIARWSEAAEHHVGRRIGLPPGQGDQAPLRFGVAGSPYLSKKIRP